MVMTGIDGFFSLSMAAIAGAFEGEIAIPATPLAMRSATSWTSPASSDDSAGPVYRHSYGESAWSAFHFLQPLPSTVKNGLSSPFTTIASVFLSAALAEAATNASPADAREISTFFIYFL